MKHFISSTLALLVVQAKFEQTMGGDFNPDAFPLEGSEIEEYPDEIGMGEYLDEKRMEADAKRMEAESQRVVSKKYAERAYALRGSKGCSKNKRVTLFKFCNIGADAFAESATHQLYLNGFLGDTFSANSVDGCQDLGIEPRMITPEEKLKAGVREYDDFREDDFLYTLPSSYWYDNSCDAYGIVLSREHDGSWNGCYEHTGSNPDAAPKNLGLHKCNGAFQIPENSFAWFIEIESVSSDEDQPLVRLDPKADAKHFDKASYP